MRFSVFKGGPMIEAAGHVIGADLDTLNALVDKHLLFRRRSDGSGTRLHAQTIQSTPLTCSPGEDLAATHERHSAYYLEARRAREPELHAAQRRSGCSGSTPRATTSRSGARLEPRRRSSACTAPRPGLLAESGDPSKADGGPEWTATGAAGRG